MKKTMDGTKHIGRIASFILILVVILGLFVYLHFIKGVHVHTADNNDWVVETEATCTEQGYKYQMCTTCGISFNGQVIEALGHSFTQGQENVVDASCTLGGSYDLVSYCSRCNLHDSRQTVTVEPLGHREAVAVQENVVPATCEDAGSHDEVVYCSGCSIELSRNHVDDPAKGHTTATAEEDRIEATCTVNGSYTAITYCSECNEEFSRVPNTVIEAPGHTPAEAVTENVVDPTCDVAGSYDTVVYCTVCEHECSRETVPVSPTGHERTGVLQCNERNYALELHTTCLVCGKEEVFYKEDIDAIDPEALTYEQLLAPTCTSTGLGEYAIDIVLEGSAITDSCDVVEPKTPHHLMCEDAEGNPYDVIVTEWHLDAYGNVVYGYRVDEQLGIKYYDEATPGITVLVDKTKGESYKTVWDSNGFAQAYYECEDCGIYGIVLVYNADYDTRVQ